MILMHIFAKLKVKHLRFETMKRLVNIQPQPQQHPQMSEWGSYA